MHSAINNSTDIRNTRKRSEYDPIWKRIYVERVWRFALLLLLVYYVVKVIPDSLHTKEGAFNFLIFIYALAFLFSIVNYFFIERYWKRIGRRRADALQLAGNVALPSAKSVQADDSAFPVPTTLRLQWGRAWVIVLRVALFVLLLLAAAGGIAIWLYPHMHGTLEVVTIITLIFSVLIALVILFSYFLVGRFQGQTIAITDEGIKTRYLRQERFIRWDEARLFASYGAKGINKNLLVDTYELSNEETVVRWSKQQPGLTLLTVQSDEGLKDDWNWLVGRVNNLVAARTDLPLTDLSDNSLIPQWLAKYYSGEGGEQTRKGIIETQTNIQPVQAAQNEQITGGNTPAQIADSVARNDPMRRRINNRQMLLAVAIFGVFGLILLVAGIVGLFNQGDIWLGSISQFLIVAGAFLLLVSIVIGVALRVVARYWYRVQQARREVLQHASDFVAIEQPRPNTERPQSIQMGTKAVVNLLVTLGLGLIVYTILAFPFVHVNDIGLRLLVSMGFALALSLFAAILGMTLSKRVSWQRVSITSDGIGTRFGGVDSSMRWGDAVLFTTYQGTNFWGRVNKRVRIYEMASEQTVVRWQGVARMRFMGTEPKMDQQQFEQWQEQLRGYVVEKTGLPLIELPVRK